MEQLAIAWPPSIKPCRACGSTSFAIQKRGTTKRYCRDCNKRNKLAVYYANRAAILAARKARGQSDEERARFVIYRKKWALARRYGLTLAEYDALAEAHGGRCAICKFSFAEQSRHKSGHVDHDHATGFVRGLLCIGCNHGLGCFKDSPERLEAAVAYLRRAEEAQRRTGTL